jgi:hypothetical protein
VNRRIGLRRASQCIQSQGYIIHVLIQLELSRSAQPASLGLFCLQLSLRGVMESCMLALVSYPKPNVATVKAIIPFMIPVLDPHPVLRHPVHALILSLHYP